MINYLISSRTKSAAVIVKLYSKKQAFSEYEVRYYDDDKRGDDE